MNLLTLTTEQGWQIVGWTMCYFLALGTVVGLLGGAVRLLCRRANPQVRYAVSLSHFVLLALLPLGIAGWLASTTLTIVETASTVDVALPEVALPSEIDLAALDSSNMPIMPSPHASQETSSTIVQPSVKTPPTETKIQHWQQAIGWLPWVWIVGAPLMFALLFTGLVGSGRLRKRCQPVTTGFAADLCGAISTWLGIRRHITLATCEKITSPLLIGIVRPLILLPPSALTGWSPEEIEMVLLHELAHVRRWDNLVNLLQRIVEAVLFYHPVIWLVSRQVRLDREECCDAVVVARTAKPQAYAELLVALATPTQPLAGLALARHPLAGRIRRILKLEDETMLVSRSTVYVTLLSMCVISSLAFWQPVSSTNAKETVAENIEQEKTTKDTEDSSFLSLEDQRAADLAYRQLGLELEPLGKEELQRVKAMKFKGGLRVAFSNIESMRRPLQAGDLLVGLHIWPTTSLREVVNILQHGAIAELSPLKFYVIRSKFNRGGGPFGDGGGFGDNQTTDELVTGRIKVYTAANRPNKQSTTSPGPAATGRRYSTQANSSKLDLRPHKIQPGDTLNIQVANAFPDQPVYGEYRVESMGTVPLGPTYGRIKIAGNTLIEAEETIKKKLSEILKAPEVQVTLVKKATDSLPTKSGTFNPYISNTNSPKHQQAIAKIELEYAMKNWKVTKQHYEDSVMRFNAGKLSDSTLRELELESERARLQVERAKVELREREKQAAAVKERTSRVLYDGKSFEEWRSLWKNELKTKKRAEAIQAIAAFGRAGYGEEAAKTIFEVAEQYDFNRVYKQEEQLFGAIHAALTYSIPVEVYFPMLTEKYTSDPERWELLLVRLAPKIREKSVRTDLIALLKKIAESDQSNRRETALHNLVQVDPGLENQSVVETVRRYLNSDVERDQLYAIHALQNGYRILPEVVKLSFNGSEEIKKTIREVIFGREIDRDGSRRLAQKMVIELQSPNSVERTLDAVRNLAVLGRNKDFNSNRKSLAEFLDHKDRQLLIAAAVAIEKITLGSTQSVPLLHGKILDDEGNKLSDGEIQQLVYQEGKHY